MLDLADAKALISSYKYIERTCDAIDEFIFKHAINYGPDPEMCSTMDVINNIMDLMERKIKLIKLKNIIDDSVTNLNELDRQIIIIKMRFRTNVKNMQNILKLPSERTTFRRLNGAVDNFLEMLNNSNCVEDVEDIMRSENWIVRIRKNLEKEIVQA